MKRLAMVFAWLMLSLPSPAQAQAVVEGVRSPAWVEREGRRTPLAVGMRLGGGDRIESGAQGRVLLRLPEGSTVKLGADAGLALDGLEMRTQGGAPLLAGALDVLRGAFRFTTDALRRFGGQRRIDVRIATVTAGIRGTDLWGKAAPDRDIVCLIEGRIAVQRASEAAFVMDQPLSFYIAPRGAPALPVAPVPSAQLAQWAEETEIGAGTGALRRGGRWTVTLAEAPDQAAALALYDAVREAGYPAAIRPVARQDGYGYRIRIAEVASEADARAIAARLGTLPGAGEPTIAGR